MVWESCFQGCGSGSTSGRGSAHCSRTGLWWHFGEQHRRPARAADAVPGTASMGPAEGAAAGAGLAVPCDHPVGASVRPSPGFLRAVRPDLTSLQLILQNSSPHVTVKQRAPAFLAPGTARPHPLLCGPCPTHPCPGAGDPRCRLCQIISSNKSPAEPVSAGGEVAGHRVNAQKSVLSSVAPIDDGNFKLKTRT